VTSASPAASDASGLARRALHGSIAGAIAFVVNSISVLLFVPVLLQAWGSERYGLWLALQSLFGVLVTLDMGHHTFVGNELLRLYPTDRAAARALLAAGLLGALLLGALELGVLGVLLLGGALPWALGSPDHPLAPEAPLAFTLLLLAWVAQGAAGGVWVRLYPAAGQYARSVWWGIAQRVLQTLVILAAVWLGAGILGAVLASTLAALGYAMCSFYDVRVRFAELYPFWRGARLGAALKNLGSSLVVTVCALLAQLSQHGVIFALSSRAGLASVAAFITTRTLANVFVQAAGIVTGPLLPEMVRLAAFAEHRKLAGLVRAIWFVTGAPVNLGLCLGNALFGPLYAAWTGGMMAFDAELFAWLGVAISLRCFGAPFAALIGGLNALRAQLWCALGQSLGLLAGVAVAVPWLGLRGAGLALAFSELCGSALLPILLCARLQPELMRALPARALLMAALPCVVAAVSLLGAARGVLGALAAIAVAVGALGLLYWLQWSELGAPMQARLLVLIRPSRRPIGAP
jgi:O-antigen/teichoic acid export membrane protein